MYTITEDLKKELKKPLGDLTNDFPTGKEIITVGDVCSRDALLKGIEPKLLVYDNMIERKPSDDETKRIIENWNVITLKVKNDAGTISEQSIKSIELALTSDGKYKVEVEGEEDLLTLICVLYAEVGTAVCYGQPGEGIVVVDVNKSSKDMVKDILSRMEVRK
ncbi:MAG: DUF359 domain-containing protein [Candidatus Diapherotrites archaeon]|nr:DUF359 domain-containing protein [Candidatus Diapherotrites archaeon]